MTIQEILEAHYVTTTRENRVWCKACGHLTEEPLFNGEETYLLGVTHQAEVLDKRIQAGARQAQMNVLNGVASAWEEMASPGAHHLYARMLRETANRIGADNNGS